MFTWRFHISPAIHLEGVNRVVSNPITPPPTFLPCRCTRMNSHFTTPFQSGSQVKLADHPTTVDQSGPWRMWENARRQRHVRSLKKPKSRSRAHFRGVMTELAPAIGQNCSRNVEPQRSHTSSSNSGCHSACAKTFKTLYSPPSHPCSRTSSVTDETC